MGHSFALDLKLSIWAALLFGVLYGSCALGVCNLLLSGWERELKECRGSHAAQTAAAAPPTVVQQDVEPHKSAPLPERELTEAIDLGETALETWVEEPEGQLDDRIRTLPDALLFLRSCLAKAEELQGLGSGSERFRALSLDNYAIDLRRLFDLLRRESHTAAILLFSREEKRTLFANEGVRLLLGWSPERFCQSFPSLISGGRHEWEDAISQLESDHEATARLVVQTKDREAILVQSVWRLLSAGSFRGLVLGVWFM